MAMTVVSIIILGHDYTIGTLDVLKARQNTVVYAPKLTYEECSVSGVAYTASN